MVHILASGRFQDEILAYLSMRNISNLQAYFDIFPEKREVPKTDFIGYYPLEKQRVLEAKPSIILS